MCVSFGSRRSDHIFFRPWKLADVVFDKYLLENQLPFFILKKLFEISSVAPILGIVPLSSLPVASYYGVGLTG